METEATAVQKGRSLPTIGMHKQSRTLTKSKPKIRIIHIYAPEVIKTDASNFRELVQQLTGKPDHHRGIHHQKGLKRNPKSRGTHDDHHDHDQVLEVNKSHRFSINSEVEDEEEEEMVSMTWKGNGGESSGGFFSGLGDLDGFIQELGEFPYLPFTIDHPSLASTSSHLHGGVFAESHHFA